MRNRLIVGLQAAVLIAASAPSLAHGDDAGTVSQRLQETRITHDFKDTPLAEVAEKVGELSGVLILIDPTALAVVPKRPGQDGPRCEPAVSAPVTLDVREMNAEEALDRIARGLHLHTSIRRECVLIGSRPFPATCVQPDVPEEVLEKLRDPHLRPSEEFKDSRLPAMLRWAARWAGRPARLDLSDEYLLVRPMTLKLRGLTTAGCLDVLCSIGDLTWTVREGEILFTDRVRPRDLAVLEWTRRTKVSFAFEDQRLIEALDFLQTLDGRGGRPGVSQSLMPDQRVTLEVKDVPLSEAYDRLCATAGLKWVVRDGVIRIGTDKALKALDAPREPLVKPDQRTEADKEIIIKLRETIVSLTGTFSPVEHAVTFLAGLTGLNMTTDVADPVDDDRIVMLRVTQVSCDTTLKLITEQTGVAWEVLDGVVCVAKRGRLAETAALVYGTLAAKPDDAKGRILYKALREQRISFGFKDQPVLEALDLIVAQSGLNIEADPDIDKERTVTLKLKDVRLGTAFNLFCRSAGLKWEHRPGANTIRVFAEGE